MMSNERVAFVQKQAGITVAQVTTLLQYVRDNCANEMWKDVFLTELNVIHKRLSIIDQMCTDFLITVKMV